MTVNTVELYYEVRGAGFPILGIHGTPSSAVMWEDAAGTLGLHGRCITYDRRGFFRSDRAAGFDAVDLGDHVDDAAGLLEALDATPAIVIGRSTGGLIALELARRSPDLVRALVLLEPAVFTIDPEAESWGALIRDRTLRAGASDPGSAAETAVRVALGDCDVGVVSAGAPPGVLSDEQRGARRAARQGSRPQRRPAPVHAGRARRDRDAGAARLGPGITRAPASRGRPARCATS